MGRGRERGAYWMAVPRTVHSPWLQGWAGRWSLKPLKSALKLQPTRFTTSGTSSGSSAYNARNVDYMQLKWLMTLKPAHRRKNVASVLFGVMIKVREQGFNVAFRKGILQSVRFGTDLTWHFFIVVSIALCIILLSLLTMRLSIYCSTYRCYYAQLNANALNDY
jgi:hypothetical protein